MSRLRANCLREVKRLSRDYYVFAFKNGNNPCRKQTTRVTIDSSLPSLGGDHSHPFALAMRAASIRFAAPSLLMASER